MLSFLTRYRKLLAIFGILTLGFLLRLSFRNDIEYKEDETYTFIRVVQFNIHDRWQWLGMPSSVTIANPGFTVWIFLLIGQILQVHTPPQLAHGVQILNCSALVLMLYFLLKYIPKDQKRIWIWGLAIAAVNPISIVLQRKIWPQSVVPFFSMVLIVFWFHRNRNSTAFIWGILSAILGQFHMAGFFFSASLVIWTIFFDRWKKTKWKMWSLGSLTGALPMIPWILHTIESLKSNTSAFKWVRIFMFKYWNYWLVGTFGTNLSYSLGDDFYEFLKYPYISGVPTYLVCFSELSLFLLMLWLVTKLFFYWKRKKDRFRSIFIGETSETSFLISAGLWGTGILMTVSAISMKNHYLIVLFPIQFIWISQAFLRFGRIGQQLLLAVFILQCSLSINFLYYIHINGGSKLGEYGVAYSKQ